MRQPEEYEENSREKGFPILDDDSDLIFGDLGGEPCEETNLDKVRRLLGRNRTVCLDPTVRRAPG